MSEYLYWLCELALCQRNAGACAGEWRTYWLREGEYARAWLDWLEREQEARAA